MYLTEGCRAPFTARKPGLPFMGMLCATMRLAAQPDIFYDIHSQELVQYAMKYRAFQDIWLLVFVFSLPRPCPYSCNAGVCPAELSGRTMEARALLRELIASAKPEYVSPLDLARVYLRLGERQDALD